MNARIAASALAALFACTSALGADEVDPDNGGLWATSGFLSKHTSHRHEPKRGWNESNGGIGVEYSHDSNWRIVGGVYENSVYKTSHYAQIVWSPDVTTRRFDDWKLNLGVAVGVVDGYPRMGGGGFVPTLLPVASAEWKRIGINLTYIPSIAGNVAGAFALQAKFRFF